MSSPTITTKGIATTLASNTNPPSKTPVISQNWKALAPLIKAQKGKLTSKDQPTPNLSGLTEEEGKEDIWFEVDKVTLQRSKVEAKVALGAIPGASSIQEIFSSLAQNSKAHRQDAGRYIAMDCEMVGVGPDGVQSALARVSLVNWHGKVLLDKYVRPVERITDFRTAVSGIEPHHLENASSLSQVQEQVWELIKGKILVGHGLLNDFRVLFLEHPRKLTRDTSRYHHFKRLAKGRTPGLKRLAQQLLGLEIQAEAHDSVDDARVAMLLYRLYKDEWENSIFRRKGKKVEQSRHLAHQQKIDKQ